MHTQWAAGTIVGRFGRTDEIAAAVAYLLSDEAASTAGLNC